MDKMKNEKGTNGHKEVENLGAQEGTLSAVRAFGLGVGVVGRGFSSNLVGSGAPTGIRGPTQK